MTFDLAFIWAGLIAFAVLAYVLFDGFDLGIGILFPFLETEHDRDQAMNSVAPVWDGNETWLVLGGGGLMAVFPLAYAVVMPALYAPIIAMLLGAGLPRRRLRVPLAHRARQVPVGLGLRRRLDAGRLRAGHRARRPGAGHSGRRPRLCRRLVGLAHAVQPAHRRRAGRRLRAARRHLAHHEDRRASCRSTRYRFAWITGLGTLALIGVVSLWTPLLNASLMARWFAWPAILYAAPVPLFVAAGGLRAVQRALAQPRGRRRSSRRSRCSCCPTSASASASIPTSCRPRSPSGRPPRPTPASSFLLVGAVVLIPLILAYTAWSYWVFRGKVDPAGGYH